MGTNYKLRIEVDYQGAEIARAELARLTIIARTYDPGVSITPDTTAVNLFFTRGREDAERFRVILKKECGELVSRCEIFDLPQ